ncbi:nagb/rpia/CoA transferase-like protein [Aulographum hederae CBS 113979]|uniref:Translation initiation factor eIF2B subunit beta n=1 Tax=Aulographum hederae CBS 113979 TaxID=1176131 RepID=A0A6G1H4I5_9PEZI|nr:nagb/rpia/CoA transferase-like protein [Aulographum hederae CBS 113979]
MTLGESGGNSPDRSMIRPSLASSTSSYAPGAGGNSLFGLFSQPQNSSGNSTPARGLPNFTSISSITEQSETDPFTTTTAPQTQSTPSIITETLEGIREILDELSQVDDQIAEHALDHIHSDEIILTHTSSLTVQKFLLTAAKKRKFTVVHAESYPNDHHATHAVVFQGGKQHNWDDHGEKGVHFKPLTAAGITVVLIPDSMVFAFMSRVNKVVLSPHAVLASGSLLAASGAYTIAAAAAAHQTPVVVLSGVYKLSPLYGFDTAPLIEYGDAGKVAGYDEGELVEKVDVENPEMDFVEKDMVGLYISNLGGCAPSFLYRIVSDHYRDEDVNL